MKVEEQSRSPSFTSEGGDITEPIRIAVIGCGEIAQVMHLPYLAELPSFEIAAIADISPMMLQRVGDRYGVPHRSADFSDVLDDVEAVAILTHDHADIAIEAARRGKHIFVEKPLSFSIDGCDRMLAAAQEAAVKLMVGYMRRFDPGYEYALKRIAELGEIRYVRVHDFGGSFAIHPPVYTLTRAADIPTEAPEAAEPQIAETMLSDLGQGRENLIGALYTTLMSGIHDLAMLRGLFGASGRVLHSDLLGNDGLISVLDYGGDRICTLEQALMTTHSWWDQNISVYTDKGEVSIDLPNPYIRYAPTVVHVRTNDGDVPTTTTIPVSHDSPFKREWIHFADCIRADGQPLTTGDDARADVELAIAMVQAVRG